MPTVVTDRGHVAALDSLRAALTKKPVDQQAVQRAVQAVVDRPDDVFSWDINNRLIALTTKLRTEYLWGPPESIPAWPDPELLK